MIPDYSFELFFRDRARRALANAIADRCSPADREGLIDAITSGTGSTHITLVVDHHDDPAMLRWGDHARAHPAPPYVPAKEVSIGRVHVWVKLHERVPYGEHPALRCLSVPLWPVTRLMQQTFLDSPILRAWLVDTLSTCGGLACYLDRGDGSLVEFWPDNRAPSQYE